MWLAGTIHEVPIEKWNENERIMLQVSLSSTLVSPTVRKRQYLMTRTAQGANWSNIQVVRDSWGTYMSLSFNPWGMWGHTVINDHYHDTRISPSSRSSPLPHQPFKRVDDFFSTSNFIWVKHERGYILIPLYRSETEKWKERALLALQHVRTL